MSAPTVPAADVVNGADVLDDLHAALATYVVLPSPEAADAVTLWVAVTHALPAFQHAPRLAIKSPEKRCGKTRLLDVLAGTCHRPLKSVNATVAAIFRSIGDEHPPTLLIDEADALFGTRRAAENNEDLRALLNAGHQRGQTALRCVGPQQTPTEFSTFSMAALAGIGDLPDTITDRAIVLTMRRRRSDEYVQQFRTRRDGPRLAELRDRLADWLNPHLDALADAYPDLPVEDRAADTWESLVAVADVAGGDWPARARHAAFTLTSENDEDDTERSLTTRLLADVRDIFTKRGASFLSSTELVEQLMLVEESPWNDFDFNARKLALRMRHFGIKPKSNGSVRGYSMETLADAFDRYLRQDPSAPVNVAADQHKRADGSGAADTWNRQSSATRQDEIAGQPAGLRVLTVPDDPPAQSVIDEADENRCDCGEPIPTHLRLCKPCIRRLQQEARTSI